MKSANAIIPDSLASGISFKIDSTISTAYLLKSYDASHFKVYDKKVNIAFHFFWFYLLRALTLLKTSILNSSLISAK